MRTLRDAAVTENPYAGERALKEASQIIDHVTASVRGGAPPDDRHPMFTWMTRETPPDLWLSPAYPLRMISAFFDVAVTCLAGAVEDDPGLLPHFVTAVLALNESLTGQVRDLALEYTGLLLEHADQAHEEKLRRITRDLHDRLGEGLSVALRQLELHEIDTAGDLLRPSARIATAKESLTAAMGNLRAVTSDLRQPPIGNLRKALSHYVESVAADAELRLRFRGDESWAPPAVIDEVFLIVREATRNALKHSGADSVLIEVAFAPHGLHAWVQDDGSGILPAGGHDQPSGSPACPGGSTVGGPGTAGTGLVSMRERAALIGGRLTIASIPGQGTHVELFVPLPGHRDATRG
ncbi:histidine kinase [Actinomadura verrucosospora]|uniref:Histidine kinase n=1 Tax=Actinomadura verrucosospora TaxID=46165 RepID=A0A7D3ZUZ1_ACTVE|nr:histidine kinase [Actinomadura verrucosospora]